MAQDTYWGRRQAEADSAMERDERAVAKRTARAYETEMAALDREIASYYQRWGTDGVLSYHTMLETMDASDRDLLMRDCDAFAKAYPDLAAMVEIRKGIYKLDRLEGLQASARCHLAQATAEATDGLADHFARQAARSANAVADTMGFGRSFYSMDDDAVRRFVGTKWSGGQDYSQLIWGSTDKLAGYVADDMAKAFVRGDSYDRIGRALGHRFVDVAESSVSRLVYTEGTYVARQAQATEFQREGFDTYKLSTVGDERTCSECSGVATASESEPFRFADEAVGVNFPPLHPRCRCQVNPAVTDWDAWCKQQIDQERARKAAERFGGFSENEGNSFKESRIPTAVSWDKVNRKSYEKKMRGLVGNDNAQVFVDKARKALKHRDGTLFEDLYAINLETGEWSSVTDYSVDEQVKPSKEMNDKIGRWSSAGQPFATIHNHPRSLIPSHSDIVGSIRNGASFGVVAGHDGSLYKYTVIGKPDQWHSLEDNSIFDYICMKCGDNYIDRGIAANVERMWGVRIEHVA